MISCIGEDSFVFRGPDQKDIRRLISRQIFLKRLKSILSSGIQKKKDNLLMLTDSGETTRAKLAD